MTSSSSPILYHTVKELRKLRDETRAKNLTLALVPTMGALHEGHLSLVQLAKAKADVIVVSIFVNPTQFAPHEDLDQYPRTLTQDLTLLQPYQPYVFAPSVQEMYPFPPLTTSVYVHDPLSQVLEGEIRPHFFKGVCTIVTKLIHMVEPDVMVLGQKDAQQCIILRTMIQDLFMRVQLFVGPTVREKDGLAMSSRNRYLTPTDRSLATNISKALFKAQALFENEKVKECKKLLSLTQSILTEEPRIQIDYVHIVSPVTLVSLETISEEGGVLCVAVRIGTTRLIDNVVLGCTL